MPEFCLNESELDCVVTGEGEDTIREIISKIIDEEIIALSKFINKFMMHLKLDIRSKKIENELESQFSFYWYHFLSCQLLWLSMWQNKIKDVDLLLITIQAIIPTLKFIDKNINVKEIGLENLYKIVLHDSKDEEKAV